MKENYINAFKSLIENRILIFVIIIVSILGFGFAISHYGIGIDDTCLDRYYSGSIEYKSTNMLTSGRWGSYLIYKVLNLISFTPFWLEMIAVLIIDFTAIVICTFIKKNYGEKIKCIIPYVIFSSMYISYPLINEAFIYQSSIIAILIGNLAMIVVSVILYENYLTKKNKKIYFLVALILPIFISMYESVVQTFLLISAIFSILIIYKNKTSREAIKWIIISITTLSVAIIINYIITKIINLAGFSPFEGAEKGIYWGKIGFIKSVKILVNYILDGTSRNMKYFPIMIFNIASFIGLIMSITFCLKKKNILIFIFFVIMFFSNFSICILQLSNIMYRTCISWPLFISIIFTIFYIYISNEKKLRIIGITLSIFLVLLQTKDLNQWFYNDYIRYQRDLYIAFDLINKLEADYNVSKPLVIMGTPKKSIGRDGNQVNSISVLWWGKKAFNDNGVEFIKFLNSLGYKFKSPNDEEYSNGLEIKDSMTRYPQEGSIVELENCIIINF